MPVPCPSTSSSAVRGPPDPRRAAHPLARAVAFAVAAVPVTVAGHLAGGGALPDTASLLLGVALVTVAARCATGRRELSWPVLAGTQAAAQGLLHLLFAVSCAPAPGSHGAATAAVPGWWMVTAHLAAATVLAWLLRQGERALWASARRAATAVRRAGWARLCGPLEVVPARRGDQSAPVVTVRRPAAPTGVIARSGGLSRRGPPAGRRRPPRPVRATRHLHP